MAFKNAQFDADFASDINEKVTEKLSFDLYYCVQKSLAFNFFGWFFALLSTDSNAASHFAFYDTHIEFLMNIFLAD